MPEDEFDDDQTSEDSTSELDSFLGVVDEDDDDDGSTGISTELSGIAADMGVDPSSFDTDDELAAAIRTRVAQTNAGTLDPAEDKATTIAAVKFALEGQAGEDMDPKMRSAIDGIVNGTNAHLDDIRTQLKSSKEIHPEVTKAIQSLNRVVTSLDDDRVQVRLRAWIREGPKALQKYFGTKSTGALDQDGVEARHRRVVTKKAATMGRAEHKASRRYSLEGMFAKASRNMKGLRPETKKSQVHDDTDSGQSVVEGTTTARASGSRGNQVGTKGQDAAALDLRGENVVATAMRKSARG